MSCSSRIRTLVLSSFKLRNINRICCIQLYSNLPNPIEPRDSGLPPKKIPDLPFPTIYDEFPHAVQCYQYDGIPQLSTLCGLRKYLLPFSTMVISASIFAEMKEVLSEDDVTYIAITTACLVLSHFIITLPFQNFVGYLYINQENREIIVSHIDMWGKRIDSTFEAGDLYFKARGNMYDKLWIFLISRKTGSKFRINIRHASIYSQQLLEQTVSEIPETAF